MPNFPKGIFRQGFTLPELIIVIVIIVLTTYYGSLSYTEMLAEDRTETALDMFLHRIEQSRVDAVVSQDKAARISISLALSGYVQEYRERKFDTLVSGEIRVDSCVVNDPASPSCAFRIDPAVGTGCAFVLRETDRGSSKVSVTVSGTGLVSPAFAFLKPETSDSNGYLRYLCLSSVWARTTGSVSLLPLGMSQSVDALWYKISGKRPGGTSIELVSLDARFAKNGKMSLTGWTPAGEEADLESVRIVAKAPDLPITRYVDIRR